MTTTFSGLPPLSPVDADIVPADKAIGGTTYRTTWADVFALLLAGSNTATVSPQAVAIDDAAHVGLIVQLAAAQAARAFQILDSAGGELLAFTASNNRIVFDGQSGSDSTYIGGIFGTLQFGGGSTNAQYFEAGKDQIRVNSGVIESQTDGGPMTLRARTAGGTNADGSPLTLRGADGGSGGGGNHNGGDVHLAGGALHGSGVDGNTVLLWDGAAGRGKLCVGNTIASASGPVGTVVAKLPVYDETGALVGYLPLYDAIT
jgi:hypothetical protein